MKDKLIAVIREVPISQTYEEYVQALADRLVTVMEDTRIDTLWEVYNHFLKLLPVQPIEKNARRKGNERTRCNRESL